MVLDTHQRPLRNLRISVTDRCNYRCTYCMPHAEYQWTPKHQLLTFEEITRLAGRFVAAGVRSIRLTGGEPLLRHDIDRLVLQLASLAGLEDLSLTTNASRLAEQAQPLHSAGLRRINISLDTLQPDRFRALTQRDGMDDVLRGLAAAQAAGFDPIKVNMVVQRGVNEDEILPMLEFCQSRGFSLRYIEYMDVGTANRWQLEQVVPQREILELIQSHVDAARPRRQQSTDPALLYPFASGHGDVGIIASVTAPFCGECSRARLTAEGQLVTCLFAQQGTDLRGALRAAASDAELDALITGVWNRRTDRFSDERLRELQSLAGYDPEARSKLEMISLGG